MQCEVVAILDWKVDENADPLADVAYFMMMFLQPGDYGYRYKQLPKLLLGEWMCSVEHSYISVVNLMCDNIRNQLASSQ